MTILSKVQNVVILDAEFHEKIVSYMPTPYWFLGRVGTLFYVQDENYYAFFVPKDGGSVMLAPGVIVESAR